MPVGFASAPQADAIPCAALLAAGTIGALLAFGLGIVLMRQRIARSRGQENALRALLRALPDLVVTIDDEGRRFEILSPQRSESTHPLKKYMPPLLIGSLPPEQMESVLTSVRQARDSGAVQTLEYAVHRGPTDEMWIGLSLAPIDSSRSALVVMRDITAQKKAENAAREAEKELRRTADECLACRNRMTVFLENIPDPAWMKDEQGRFVAVNTALSRICRKPKDQLLGQTLSDIHLPIEKQLLEQERQVRNSETPLRFESCLSFDQGETQWFEIVRSPVRDEAKNKRLVGSVGIARNITSTKRNETALVHAQERFRAIVEKASDCFVVLDRDKRITYIAPSVLNVTGRSPEELLGKRFDNNIHPDDVYKVSNVFARVAEKRTDQQSVTCRVKHQDDAWHTVEAVLSNLEDNPAVGGIVINFRDITERRLLERQIQQAQKMETMGQLAGGVAHDFNNCLQSIEGLTDLLIQGTAPESEERRDDLIAIKQAAHQAASVTRQLLAFSQRQTFDPRILDLNTVMKEQQKMLVRLIGENISLEFQAHSPLWKTRADVGQLQQVIMNLVINSRDAMPKGGHILIKTNNVAYTENDILPGYDMRAGRFVQLSVSDTGTGMTPDVLAHIFEPFFTTKAEGKGTGLGLAVVHGIVKQHDGWIHVYSTPDNGSEFKIYLPSCTPTEPAPQELFSGELPRGKGQRILLVEDDLPTRIVTNRNLTQQGYTVRETTSLAEARVLFQRTNGAFDMLLCDVVLPDGNGVDLTRELLRQKSDLRIILTSGYADDKARWREITDEGWCFLQKPYSFADLFCLMDQCFRTREPVGSFV